MAIRRTDLAHVPAPRRHPDGHAPAAAYDWENWADGAVWQLFPGADFTVGYGSFSTIAHNYARRHGMRAEIRKVSETDGFSVLVQFFAVDPR